MAKLPQPGKPFWPRIYKLEEAVRRLQNASPFSGTGLSIPADGTTQVEGNLWVTGDFTADGKITNGALTNPVVPAVAHAETDNFSLVNGPNVAKATATVPVPAGYTQAMVTATATMSVWNPNASDQVAYVAAWIEDDSTRGASMPVTIRPSTQGTSSHTATALLTSLGSSFTVQAAASSFPANWAASTSNFINIDATILFLR